MDAILEAQEAERSRIARELHDETGSALTAVLLGLTAIDGAATLPEAHQASTALRETARSTLENVGRLAFALRPSALDEFGLVPLSKTWAAVWRSGAGRRSSSTSTFRPASDCLPSSKPPLFRITQEALTNVVKHAEANNVHVILARRERSVVLTVEDDGRGFSRAQAPVAGSGSSGCASESRPSTEPSTSNRNAAPAHGSQSRSRSSPAESAVGHRTWCANQRWGRAPANMGS